MIATSQINEDVILERAEALSDELLEVLVSPVTGDIIETVCRDHHLADEDKIEVAKQLVGLVILGFIHDYDLAREINNYLELNNPPLASDIFKAIDAKVFSPIKTNLSKNYRPVSGGGAIDETIPKPPPVGLPIAQKTSDITAPAPMALTSMKAPPLVAPSAPFFSGTKQSATNPTPSAPIRPPTSFDAKLAKFSSPSAAQAKPAATPSPSPSPAPFMIQQKTEFKPVASSASPASKLNLIAQRPTFGGPSAAPGARPTEPIRSAKIVFGNPPAAPTAPPRIPSMPATAAPKPPAAVPPLAPTPGPGAPTRPAGIVPPPSAIGSAPLQKISFEPSAIPKPVSPPVSQPSVPTAAAPVKFPSMSGLTPAPSVSMPSPASVPTPIPAGQAKPIAMPKTVNYSSLGPTKPPSPPVPK